MVASVVSHWLVSAPPALTSPEEERWYEQTIHSLRTGIISTGNAGDEGKSKKRKEKREL